MAWRHDETCVPLLVLLWGLWSGFCRTGQDFFSWFQMFKRHIFIETSISSGFVMICACTRKSSHETPKLQNLDQGTSNSQRSMPWRPLEGKPMRLQTLLLKEKMQSRTTAKMIKDVISLLNFLPGICSSQSTEPNRIELVEPCRPGHVMFLSKRVVVFVCL